MTAVSKKNISLHPSKIYEIYFKQRFGSLDDTSKQKANAYLYMILTFITVSFFGLFAIKPTLETISNLNRQYEDSKLVLEALKTKNTALQKLDAEYTQVQADLPFIYSAIPKNSKIPYLARQIEIIAQQSTVSLTKLDFGTVEIYPSTKTTNYAFTFNLIVEGEEQNINTFISTLINFDRILSIDRIVTGKTDKDTFGGTISGKAYFNK